MEVMPGLFLGDEADSRNAARFDMVVNCTADLPFHGDAAWQTQVRVPVKDNGDPRQQTLFVEHASDDATQEGVSNAIVGGGRVLVHCRAGQQRSAAFVAVVLCRSGLCGSPGDAVELIRRKKRDAFHGSVNFGEALRRMFPPPAVGGSQPLSVAAAGGDMHDSHLRRHDRRAVVGTTSAGGGTTSAGGGTTTSKGGNTTPGRGASTNTALNRSIV
jgi:hypothetical protein